MAATIKVPRVFVKKRKKRLLCRLDEADLPVLPIAWFSSVISALERTAGFLRNMAAKGLGSERK